MQPNLHKLAIAKRVIKIIQLVTGTATIIIKKAAQNLFLCGQSGAQMKRTDARNKKILLRLQPYCLQHLVRALTEILQ